MIVEIRRIWYNDREYESNAPEEAAIMKKYLTLVNKTHRLPEDWMERITLISAKNAMNETYQLERETLKQFLALRDSLLIENIDIEVESAFRSIEEQTRLWAEFEKEYGLAYCEQYVAVPGNSEHHMGLAVDICFVIDGQVMEEHAPGKEALFARVHAAMPEYGFILRYPVGKEAVTGYGYEPWHLRYVGAEAAKEITAREIALEEYEQE